MARPSSGRIKKKIALIDESMSDEVRVDCEAMKIANISGALTAYGIAPSLIRGVFELAVSLALTMSSHLTLSASQQSTLLKYSHGAASYTKS
jgi:hypothetical protein